MKRLKDRISIIFKEWINKNNYRLAVFNILIVSLFLLRSAGYFQPYFPISVNFIVVVGLILSTFLLGVKSVTTFLITLFFWIFAALLQILRIDVWAERTGIYAYESLVFGVLLFIFESVYSKYKK
ncbi:MAG TPA: hypothetical protein VG895_03055 [Patescibacteria group bacterium]|nr:hypothetical protein [Patescibacteria group bacterium]